MTAGAPRLMSRMWRASARGALLAMALVAAGPVIACLDTASSAALPGSVTTILSPDGVSQTWYEDASDAYGHGIMGSVQDATTLRAVIGSDGATCRVLSVLAGDNHVFEDVAPRLSDMDGDGAPEVIAVRSSFFEGAQLVIYGADGDHLTIKAATPYIGTRNRWLAPAGWGDLDGDGRWEIAYVDRPHLAKTLRVWRWTGDDLVQVATLAGVTNHRIGDEVIWGGTRDCGSGPEMILARGDWFGLLSVRLRDGQLSAQDLDVERFDDALACR